MLTNILTEFNLSGEHMLAVGLTLLKDSRITDHGIAVRCGYRILAALRALAEPGVDYLPDDELSYFGKLLVKLGFAERHAERGAGAWRFKITHAGLVFLGERKPMTTAEPLAGWVVLTIKGRSGTYIDLRNYEHVGLMVKLLDMGYGIAGAPLADTAGDTEPITAVQS